MPSRSGRLATAPSRIRARRPRKHAMRISEQILSVALFGLGLGLATAHAFDGTRSPSDIAPAVGVEITPEAVPGLGVGAGRPEAQHPLTSFQAFQTGARALRAGDTKA